MKSDSVSYHPRAGIPAMLSLAALLAPSAAFSQAACPEPAASSFTKVTMVAPSASVLAKPVHLAVAPDKRVFVAEMESGNIRVVQPGGQVSTAGKVATRYDNEDGLLGIALHPKFAQNHWLFALFTDPSSSNKSHVLNRYTVNGDVMDMGSKVEILRFARVSNGRYHAAGGLVFDAQDNLIISTGDDTNPHDGNNNGYGAIYTKDAGSDAQKSSANTNDMRGKILRIHPEAEAQGNGKYYTIPKGNMKEVLGAESFWDAAELAKVLPEIYAMGLRNPYRPGVDYRTGAVYWGEVGPDANDIDVNRGPMGHDEFNVAVKPGNFGWPYCNANQLPYNNMDYSGSSPVNKGKFDCASLTNTSPNNTGVGKLPPAQAPLIWYAGNNSTDFKEMGAGAETAIGGPMYRYDRGLQSNVKFPPFYDGKVAFWDWSRQVHKILSFDAQGKNLKFHNFPVTGLRCDVSGQFGPDGALYILQYSNNGYSDNLGALYRIEYKGTITPGEEACLPPSGLEHAREGGRMGKIVAGLHGFTAFHLPETAAGVDVFNLKGEKVWSYRRQGVTGRIELKLPAGLAEGLVQTRFF